MQENHLEQVVDCSPIIGGEAESVKLETAKAKSIMDNESGATSYGKFKSAECLLNAYKQLEKEFTKKSQTLRTFQESQINVDDTISGMISVNPQLSNYADELKAAITSGSNSSIKLAECLNGRVTEPCHIINDKKFLDKYVYSNADIRGKIIAEYLDNLQDRRSPMTINGRGNAYVSPAYKPHSLDEASKLAKKYIENRRI